MRKKFLIILLLLALVVSVFSVLTVGQASVVEPTYSTTARNNLSDYDKALYDQLSEKLISLTTSDATQSTVFQIDLTKLGGAKISWSASESTTITDAFSSQFDVSLVLTALLHDMPLETFWYDKTAGSSTIISNDGKNITSFKIKMKVTTQHRGLGYGVDYPCVMGVKTIYDTTYNNALYYVNKWAGASDYAKIKGYVQDICSLVSYENSVTLPSYNGDYTDVWQATYVFDNDTTTNVVCEGYSKAFQLLCNLSNFSDLTCYTINGSTTGGHMWNIVTLEGNNYLIDVTNTDEGSIGSLGGLVLNAPKSGSPSEGYTFDLSTDLTYFYKDDAVALFLDKGVLTLSTSDYTPPSVQFSLNGVQNLVYDGEEITIGNNSTYDIYYTLSSGFTTSYNWDWEFFLDNNGTIGTSVGNSVKDAGVYWLKVSATRKLIPSETGSVSVKLEIKKAKLTIDSATFNKTYDGTKTITPTSITLNGIKGSDIVSVDYNNSLFESPTASAGEYDYLYVKNLVFMGDDATNYTHEYTPSTQVAMPVTIAKRAITATLIYEYAEMPLTFSEFDFNVSAQYNGVTKSGTVTWYDDVEIVDLTTPVSRGKQYTWVLTYDDTNFSNSTGTVVIYPNDTVYKVNATSQDTTQGTVTSSKKTFLSGESVTVTANAKNGYTFTGWQIDGVTVSTDSQYTFTVDSNLNIVANFVATTSSGGGEGGNTEQSIIVKVLDILKVVVPYLPYVIIGGGVLGLVILILLYSKISKSKKKK